MDKKAEQAILQNLEDAGCCKQLTEVLMKYEEAGETGEVLCLLRKHRAELLENIHTEQRKLDCLDYLIHKMKESNLE